MILDVERKSSLINKISSLSNKKKFFDQDIRNIQIHIHLMGIYI